MSNLLKKHRDQPTADRAGRYERFQLSENPFPTEPVNKDSEDRRINGDIYEVGIRTKEYSLVEEAFLKKPQSDRNRLRLGYICDTSYIGRGNGKSAFLVNLTQRINKNYCLDISNETNKCFAVYVTPEPGGRTKTFPAFLDLIFEAMLQSGILNVCLATLRLEAISALYPGKESVTLAGGDAEVVRKVNNADWLRDQGIDVNRLATKIAQHQHLQTLPSDFPLVSGRNALIEPFVSSETFKEYYLGLHRTGNEKHECLLSYMVQLFLAAGFNGAYILVDDFERIPDFQSGRQRKDFAIELRSALLDGPYFSARTAFYTMLLTLHAGVPRLVSDAWISSGLGNRYPIMPKIQSAHWVAFEKLTREYVSLLLKKYLSAYRIGTFRGEQLTPFTPEAVTLIAEMNENNAAKILRSCWDLLEKAADEVDQLVIDAPFVRAQAVEHSNDGTERPAAIEDPAATDLMQKATGGQE